MGQTDLAPVCLFRILYGLLLIVWLFQLLLDLNFFFTDEGMVPRSELPLLDPNGFTLLASFGQLWQVQLFWAATLAVAVMVTIGYRTRLACLLASVAVISFIDRNALIMDGSDFLFKLAPLWLAFTGAGQRWSVDAWLQRRRGLAPNTHGPAFPVRILELQLGWVYLASGLEKWAGRQWRGGTALSTVLQLSHTFARPFATPLAFDGGLAHALTWGTLAIELAFLPLILAPGPTRLMAGAGSVLLQLGILTTMDVGNFPLIMLAMTLLLVPADWVEHSLSRWRERVRVVAAARPPRSAPGALTPALARRGGRGSILRWVVLALLAACSFGTALPSRFGTVWPPGPVEQAMFFGGLDQSWKMFAPEPSNYDWWMYAPGQMSDGSTMDVFTHAAPSRAPRFPGPFYSRWMKVADRLSDSRESAYLQEYGRAICRTFDNHLAPGQPKLDTFQIYMEEVWLQPPGQGPAKTDERLLWDHHCFS